MDCTISPTTALMPGGGGSSSVRVGSSRARHWIVGEHLCHGGEPEVPKQRLKFGFAAVEIDIVANARPHRRTYSRLTRIDFPRMHVEHERLRVGVDRA